MTSLPSLARRTLRPVEALQTKTYAPRHFDEFEDGECYPAALVEMFLTAYTQPGDVIFDPFAGSGTTLAVAERLERKAIGLEIHSERVQWCAQRLNDPTAIRQADARQLPQLMLPQVDLAITSPPYMTKYDHPENPLTGYQTMDGNYQRYLTQLTEIFGNTMQLLKPGARLVINVANLNLDNHFTPLAWDLAAKVSQVAKFEREIILDWDHPADWATNDYCLVFTGA